MVLSNGTRQPLDLISIGNLQGALNNVQWRMLLELHVCIMDTLQIGDLLERPR